MIVRRKNRFCAKMYVPISVVLIALTTMTNVSIAYAEDGKSSTTIDLGSTSPVQIPSVEPGKADKVNTFDTGKLIVVPKVKLPEPIEKLSVDKANNGKADKNIANNIDGLINPLKNPVQTSDYGYRIHPVTGESKLHAGVDYGATCGTNVFAPSDGKVSMAEWKNDTAGNAIVVDHLGFEKTNTQIRGEDSLSTSYYHLSNIHVNEGEIVKQGQFIGKVGNTGRSTGCHLHWEVMVNEVNVEPTQFLTSSKKDYSNVYFEEPEE